MLNRQEQLQAHLDTRKMLQLLRSSVYSLGTVTQDNRVSDNFSIESGRFMKEIDIEISNQNKEIGGLTE